MGRGGGGGGRGVRLSSSNAIQGSLRRASIQELRLLRGELSARAFTEMGRRGRSRNMNSQMPTTRALDQISNAQNQVFAEFRRRGLSG